MCIRFWLICFKRLILHAEMTHTLPADVVMRVTKCKSVVTSICKIIIYISYIKQNERYIRQNQPHDSQNRRDS